MLAVFTCYSSVGNYREKGSCMQCKIEPKCLPELHNWHPAERKRKWPCIVERWPFNRGGSTV